MIMGTTKKRVKMSAPSSPPVPEDNVKLEPTAPTVVKLDEFLLAHLPWLRVGYVPEISLPKLHVKAANEIEDAIASGVIAICNQQDLDWSTFAQALLTRPPKDETVRIHFIHQLFHHECPNEALKLLMQGSKPAFIKSSLGVLPADVSQSISINAFETLINAPIDADLVKSIAKVLPAATKKIGSHTIKIGFSLVDQFSKISSSANKVEIARSSFLLGLLCNEFGPENLVEILKLPNPPTMQVVQALEVLVTHRKCRADVLTFMRASALANLTEIVCADRIWQKFDTSEIVSCLSIDQVHSYFASLPSFWLTRLKTETAKFGLGYLLQLVDSNPRFRSTFPNELLEADFRKRNRPSREILESLVAPQVEDLLRVERVAIGQEVADLTRELDSTMKLLAATRDQLSEANRLISEKEEQIRRGLGEQLVSRARQDLAARTGVLTSVVDVFVVIFRLSHLPSLRDLPEVKASLAEAHQILQAAGIELLELSEVEQAKVEHFFIQDTGSPLSEGITTLPAFVIWSDDKTPVVIRKGRM